VHSAKRYGVDEFALLAGVPRGQRIPATTALTPRRKGAKSSTMDTGDAQETIDEDE
jgi:hypothetical protein